MSKPLALKIVRIDLNTQDPTKAMMYVTEAEQIITHGPVLMYCIPILISDLHEQDLSVGGTIILDIKSEGN